MHIKVLIFVEVGEAYMRKNINQVSYFPKSWEVAYQRHTVNV